MLLGQRWVSLELFRRPFRRPPICIPTLRKGKSEISSRTSWGRTHTLAVFKGSRVYTCGCRDCLDVPPDSVTRDSQGRRVLWRLWIAVDARGGRGPNETSSAPALKLQEHNSESSFPIHFLLCFPAFRCFFLCPSALQPIACISPQTFATDIIPRSQNVTNCTVAKRSHKQKSHQCGAPTEFELEKKDCGDCTGWWLEVFSKSAPVRVLMHSSRSASNRQWWRTRLWNPLQVCLRYAGTVRVRHNEVSFLPHFVD